MTLNDVLDQLDHVPAPAQNEPWTDYVDTADKSIS